MTVLASAADPASMHGCVLQLSECVMLSDTTFELNAGQRDIVGRVCRAVTVQGSGAYQREVTISHTYSHAVPFKVVACNDADRWISVTPMSGIVPALTGDGNNAVRLTIRCLAYRSIESSA